MKNYTTFEQSLRLNENIDKARKVLKEMHCEETDPKFKELKNLLSNNMGYLGKFTEWLFKDGESMEFIKEVLEKLKMIKIDKKIEDFEKLEKLYDYLQDYEINKKVTQALNALPSRSREMADDKVKNLLKLNIDAIENVKKFYSKKGGRYSKLNSKALFIDTENLIKNLKGVFNLQTIKEKIKAHKCNVDVIYESDDKLILNVKDYASSHILGSQSWCISTSKSMWDHYVTPYNLQYFIYDFTKTTSDIKSMIGVTISPGKDKKKGEEVEADGNIYTAHWRDDSRVTDNSYFDEEE